LPVGKRYKTAARERKRRAAVRRRIFTLSPSVRPNGVRYRFRLLAGQLEVAGHLSCLLTVVGPLSARSSTRRYRQDLAVANEIAANLLQDAHCFMSCPTHATTSRKCENSIGADPGQQ